MVSDMPHAQLNGVNLYYERIGSGEPIILLTGFAGDSGFWRRASEMLSSEFDVITIDNRGAGRTQYGGDFTMDDLSKDVISLLDHLDLMDVNIVGWSMGSHIAMGTVLVPNQRIRTLTLISSYLFRPARSDYILTSLLDSIQNGAPVKDLALVLNCMLHTEDFFERMKEENKIIRLPDLKDPKGLRYQLNAVNLSDITDDVSKISIPTLVIHGDKDIMVEQQEGIKVANKIPESELMIIEGEGHLIPADLYVPQMINFIKQHS